MGGHEINKQLINVLNGLDSTTYNHSVRVVMLATEIEEYLGMTDHKLMCASLFHDIGKTYIPFNILDKNSRLSKLERELIDLHPYIGYKILSDLGVDEDICRIVFYHHGFRPLTIHDVGYYDKNAVYEEACILHTIDVFEALTSDRPYHRGCPSQEALHILMREGGYDARTLEYITAAIESKEMESSAVHRTCNYKEPDMINQMILEMVF